MNDSIDSIEPWDKEGQLLHVLVETPQGSRVKYAYDPKSGFFVLRKALPAGMIFPFNFGFVPKTLADDGDPLDILILNEEPLFAGCLLNVKPVAVLMASQTEDGKVIRNDRVIGQAIGHETPPEFETMKLRKDLVFQIDFFFTAYNKLYGKKFKLLGTGGPQKAIKIVKRAMKLYKKKQ